MKNSTKTRETVGQLRAACLEIARGFEEMEQRAGEVRPDTWAEAVNALTETLAVARVAWVESTLVPREPPGPDEYSVQLLDAAGEPMAGASFTEPSDDAAEDEARALALFHDWCRRVRLLAKASGRSWTIEIRA